MNKQQKIDLDNRLLSMITRHFPSLPLDDRYTDWTRWLGFARAVYTAGSEAERDAWLRECAIEDDVDTVVRRMAYVLPNAAGNAP